VDIVLSGYRDLPFGPMAWGACTSAFLPFESRSVGGCRSLIEGLGDKYARVPASVAKAFEGMGFKYARVPKPVRRRVRGRRAIDVS
jgi:hypothetical protein